MVPPSMLAAASITTAIEGLTRLENNNLCYSISMPSIHLHQITGIELVRHSVNTFPHFSLPTQINSQ